MKRYALLTLILVSTALPVAGRAFDDNKKEEQQEKAKSKERVYNADFEKVWTACVQAANENFVMEHSEKESGILNFHSGTSLTSNGFRVGVTVIKLDDGRTKVVLNPQKKGQLFAWGAGGRIADKYFKAVNSKLEH